MENSIEAVFIEFGRLPKHAALNIIRFKKLFPEIPAVLLTDLPKKAKQLSRFCKIVEWEPRSYEELEKLTNYQNSRDKFWLHTTSRLFAFCDYHIVEAPRALLHIESDVLLMGDFPFKTLQETSTLMWGRYNEERDVAALVFSPSKSQSSTLKVLMRDALEENPALTDMSMLPLVSKKLGPLHAYFPSFTSSDSRLINRKSLLSNKDVEVMSMENSKFNGIFDHQVIGMFLDGIDPKHTFGLRKNLFRESTESGESFVDPTQVSYSIKFGYKIEVKEDLKTYPLYSIHLHSKSLKWFKLEKFEGLADQFDRVNKGIQDKHFDFLVFFNLVKSNLKQKTFLRWLWHGLKR
jgi:hypothetical protein